MENKLKEHRQRVGVTQEQLAQLADISETHYQRIEYRKHDPVVSTAQLLARALGVTVDELFLLKAHQSPPSAN